MFSKVSAAVFILVFFTPRSLPQSTFGGVVGVVKDPSQSAVPGAQVVLTRLEDKSEHPTTTDADGAFHLVNLKPGHYDLVITAVGFADLKISSAELDARQTLRF